MQLSPIPPLETLLREGRNGKQRESFGKFQRICRISQWVFKLKFPYPFQPPHSFSQARSQSPFLWYNLHFCGAKNKFLAAAYVTMHIVKSCLLKWCLLDFWRVNAHIWRQLLPAPWLRACFLFLCHPISSCVPFPLTCTFS